MSRRLEKTTRTIGIRVMASLVHDYADIRDLRPIADARRDGTPILIKLKAHIPVASMQRWQGLTFVGCLREPYDFTWRFAAPIGQGGFRDEWIEGWWSLPHARAASPAGCANTADARTEPTREQLVEALRPFAFIGLDVLKNRPGWANPVFWGAWCGYRLTYTDFERATAAALALTQKFPATATAHWPADNYKRLPKDVRCRCVRMWQAPDGSHWCCNQGPEK
jgi:hypothetical protein